MTTLDRWLPFKFPRKNAEGKAETTSAAPAAPTRGRRPFPEFMELWASMSPLARHFFNDPFIREPFAGLGEAQPWFGDFTPASFQAHIDVVDEESNLRVSVELPGMTKDDVHLTVEDDVLTIHGKKENKEESKENGVFRTERFYGFVHRTVPLPRNLDHAKAEATFDRGVLTVRFPKTVATPTGKPIPIRS